MWTYADKTLMHFKLCLPKTNKNTQAEKIALLLFQLSLQLSLSPTNALLCSHVIYIWELSYFVA